MFLQERVNLPLNVCHVQLLLAGSQTPGNIASPTHTFNAYRSSFVTAGVALALPALALRVCVVNILGALQGRRKFLRPAATYGAVPAQEQKGNTALELLKGFGRFLVALMLHAGLG